MGSQNTVKIDLDDLGLEIDAKSPKAQEPPEKGSILRSSFRVPLGEQDDVHVTIGSRDFRVLNLSETGLQILVLKDDSLKTAKAKNEGFATAGSAHNPKVPGLLRNSNFQFPISLRLSLPS